MMMFMMKSFQKLGICGCKKQSRCRTIISFGIKLKTSKLQQSILAIIFFRNSQSPQDHQNPLPSLLSFSTPKTISRRKCKFSSFPAVNPIGSYMSCWVFWKYIILEFSILHFQFRLEI